MRERGANRNDLVDRPGPGRARAGFNRGPGRVPYRYPGGRRPPGHGHPRGIRHRQVHPRLYRAVLCAPGDRRADLLRAVRFPAVRSVGECGRHRVYPAVGAPLRAAPGSAHHARLHRHRSARLPRVPLPYGRSEPRSHLDGPVTQPHPDADLHRQLHVHLPASGPYADVEPGGGSRFLRGVAAARLSTAGGAVPTALATRAAADRPRRPGRAQPGLADCAAHHRLVAGRSPHLAANLSGLVRRRDGAGGTAGHGGPLLCVRGDSTGTGQLLHRVHPDRR